MAPVPAPTASSCCAYHRPTAEPMPLDDRRARLEAEAARLLRRLRLRGLVR